ncbi:MAG: molybdopterin-dependent oxidoreductase [Desulfobacteraceae bacterium]|nr:molybdopterin-dependent oxidoreductase [Desulfobacteraceae bacterium]
MTTRTVKSICFECHSRCGVELEIEDEKLKSVRGDKAHPISRGYICPKGTANPEIVYHPERITTPLVKSKTGFEKTSWDHALSIIADKMTDAREKFGAESVVFGSGTTRGLAPYLNRFLTCFGSPNFMAPSNMSGGPIVMGSAATCGFGLSDPDYANSRCMLLWAHNPEKSWPGLYMNDIRDGLKNGAKLIVVDPRGTRMAKKADHWLQIRPGTDVAMALCFMHVIIENELYDKAFVENWTEGFEELRAHVSEFTPEKTEPVTWVPADQIRAAASAFAENAPAAVGPGMGGVCQANDAFDLTRALTMLAAITGNLEVPGGNLRMPPPTHRRACYGSDHDPFLNLPKEQAQKKLGIDRFPLIRFIPIPSPPQTVWPAITDENPYPVKVVGLFANNSVCAYPNSQRVREVYEKLDFLFAVDYFHTPTTELADVILPPAHWTERDDVEDLLMKSHVFCQPKAVEPLPECRDEKQILIDLAGKIGMDDYFKTVRQALDYRLEPVGITYEEFKEDGWYFGGFKYKSYEKKGKFRTLSGKVALYAGFLEDLGLAPLPVFREPGESPASRPDLAEDYPLVLTTGGRLLVYYHSSHRNIASLKKRAPDPELQIHPDTARKLDIEDGEWVYLTSPRGRVEIRARYFEDIDPRVVHSHHGFWYGVENGWKRVNINMITDDEPLCPVTGSVPIKALLCRVEKMEA